MNKSKYLFFSALFPVVLVIFLVCPIFARAATGDLVKETVFDGPTCSVGVGIAFDGQYLWYTCQSGDPNLFRADPITGVIDRSYSGPPALGALSYDATRNIIWAAAAPNEIWYFVLDANKDLVGQSLFKTVNDDCGIIDGLAFDARSVAVPGDDVFYYTDDCWRTSINVYDINPFDPAPIETFTWAGPVPPPDFTYHNSGVAVGGPTLFETSVFESKVYVQDKNTKAFLFDYFVDLPHPEDLECDSNTFAPTDVMWIKEAYEPLARAFEIPADSCGTGGVPDLKIVKFYTHTNNNWNQRCIEYDTTTGDCITYRLANVNLDSDVFAPSLPVDNNTFLLYGEEKRNKTIVTPGKYIATSVVRVPLQQDITVVEIFGDCNNIGSVSPNKVPGGVQVVLVDNNGDVHDIDDDLADGIGGWIILVDEAAIIHVEDVPAESHLRVMVMFNPSEEKGIIGDSCINFEYLIDDAGEVIDGTAAVLTIVEKP